MLCKLLVNFAIKRFYYHVEGYQYPDRWTLDTRLTWSFMYGVLSLSQALAFRI